MRFFWRKQETPENEESGSCSDPVAVEATEDETEHLAVSGLRQIIRMAKGYDPAANPQIQAILNTAESFLRRSKPK